MVRLWFEGGKRGEQRQPNFPAKRRIEVNHPEGNRVEAITMIYSKTGYHRCWFYCRESLSHTQGESISVGDSVLLPLPSKEEVFRGAFQVREPSYLRLILFLLTSINVSDHWIYCRWSDPCAPFRRLITLYFPLPPLPSLSPISVLAKGRVFDISMHLSVEKLPILE